MKQPQTIKDAVELLQNSVAKVLPGMIVSVNISLVSDRAEEQVESEPLQEAKEQNASDLQSIRDCLNAYAKSVGTAKAIALVKSFTPEKTKNPADIPPEKYNDMLDQMDGVELEIKGKDTA